MTAKQYLRRVRGIEKEIQSLMETRDKEAERVTSITQRYDGDGTQSTKDPHKFDNLVMLEMALDDAIDEQYEVKAETLKLIQQVPDRWQRLVLKEYYIDMKTWEQVAVDLNYSYMHITRIHGFALREVQKILDGV